MTESIFDIFREEAREHLSAVEKAFLDLEGAQNVETRRNLIDGLFRHAHSLKGDAKVVGLTRLKEAAQVLEDLLDELRSKPEEINRESIDCGLAQFDLVRSAFDAWQQEGMAASTTAVAPEVQVASEPSPTPEVPSIPAPPIATNAQPPPATKEVPTPSPVATTPAAQPKPNTKSVSAGSGSDESFTVRVPSERLDRMLNQAGEVRIFQRSVDSIQRRLDNLSEHLVNTSQGLGPDSSRESQQALEIALDQVRRIGGELHNKRVREEMLLEGLEADIRQARLLPLVMLTDVLRRAVRDLSQSLGKPLRYEAEVGSILLDKAVIEALKDPLLHLIRNASDHGIESPEMRASAGKPKEGVLAIRATQRGHLVRIAVSDDGKGINFDHIRAKLRRTGELGETPVESLTEQELIPYLFQPGFTTAQAGDVSGRGVGLDVVFDTVRRLQGTVELASTSSAGTTFAITVPVTISSVRILTITSGGQSFGVPTSSVKLTGRVKRADLLDLAGGLVLPIDDVPVRWVPLTDLLGTAPSAQSNSDGAMSYLLIEHEGQSFALAVDDLEDEAEVLLKPLGFPLGDLPGFVGGTIRADGSVQLVLDLTSPQWIHSDARPSVARHQPRNSAKVLIVDDSPITRAVLRKVFVAAGYAVTTAIDGVDAFEQLQSRMVDVVVTDVEMPRLNGFDLTRRIKSKFGLPVILVTGREQEEHRREGLAAGADAYVVKSTFEDRGLLDIVEQFV